MSVLSLGMAPIANYNNNGGNDDNDVESVQ